MRRGRSERQGRHKKKEIGVRNARRERGEKKRR
jgi:hypothetical protein